VVTVDITADLNDEDESGFAGPRACLAGSSRRRWWRGGPVHRSRGRHHRPTRRPEGPHRDRRRDRASDRRTSSLPSPAGLTFRPRRAARRRAARGRRDERV